MIGKKWIPAVLLALLLPLQLVSAAERWLHVRVVGDAEDGESVSVNLPLSVIESFLPLIHDEHFRDGKIRMDLDDIEGVQLSELLAALRDAPDAVFVKVNSPDESVRVAKEDGFMLVHVDERGEGGDKVRVRVPLQVVEALVTDEPGELDLRKALERLAKLDGEDLVRIESDGELVRIWIDHSNGDS